MSDNIDTRPDIDEAVESIVDEASEQLKRSAEEQERAFDAFIRTRVLRKRLNERADELFDELEATDE